MLAQLVSVQDGWLGPDGIGWDRLTDLRDTALGKRNRQMIIHVHGICMSASSVELTVRRAFYCETLVQWIILWIGETITAQCVARTVTTSYLWSSLSVVYILSRLSPIEIKR